MIYRNRSADRGQAIIPDSRKHLKKSENLPITFVIGIFVFSTLSSTALFIREILLFLHVFLKSFLCKLLFPIKKLLRDLYRVS